MTDSCHQESDRTFCKYDALTSLRKQMRKTTNSGKHADEGLGRRLGKLVLRSSAVCRHHEVFEGGAGGNFFQKVSPCTFTFSKAIGITQRRKSLLPRPCPE
jgi:hypothetical protein